MLRNAPPGLGHERAHDHLEGARGSNYADTMTSPTHLGVERYCGHVGRAI